MSLDTRERVAAAKAAGHPASEVAEFFGVSEREVYRLAKLERETGTADGSTGARRGRPPKVGPEGEARLREAVAARPDATLAELAAGLALPLTPSGLWRLLDRMGYRYKKKQVHASERGRPRRRGGEG